MAGKSGETSTVGTDDSPLDHPVQQVLALGDDGPWTRSELPITDTHVDALVERDVLEPCCDGDGGGAADGAGGGGEYRLVESTAARATSETGSASESRPTTSSVARSLRTGLEAAEEVLRRPETAAVSLALALVAVVRLLPFPDVYLSGDVVLSSNDPYLYRYLVDRATTATSSPLDVVTLLRTSAVTESGEPLLVATLAFVAETLGGHPWTTGTLLAWYPVVSALVTGLVVYLLATHLSDDSRVGLAAVGFFAVVPGHVFRTGLGFADHHAFDYPWLALTALSFVFLATTDLNSVPSESADSSRRTARWRWTPRWSRRTVLLCVMFGLGVAGQVLAWEAGPLLLVPLAIAIAVYAPFAVHHDRVESFGPLLTGLVLGAVLALVAHVGAGWQSYVVAVVPTLLTVSALVLALLAFVADRRGVSAFGLVGVQFVVVVLAVVAVVTTFPDLSSELDTGVAFLFRSSSVGEMQSVTDQWGVLFGPLIMLGFTPFLAVPAMLWSAWDGLVRRRDYGWLLLSCYAWTFLALSFVQRRFTGELAPFVAVFAGLGFVVLVSKLDLAYGPRFLRMRDTDTTVRRSRGRRDRDLAIPGRRRFIMLGGFAAVFGGFPSVFSGAIHSRLTIDPRKHAAAQWMGRYVDERGWEFPRSYVFSEWGVNRMFNYFANGHSESYWYAQQNYEAFLFSSEPRAWYEELRDRTGFVVTTGPESQFVTERMKDRLHDGLGSRANDVRGLAHYRAVYSGANGFIKVFTLVPGATITGMVDGERDGPVTVRTDVSLASEGRSFTYERVASLDDQSTFAVTVPHPGEYRVGGRRVTVTESAVQQGDTVRLSDG